MARPFAPVGSPARQVQISERACELADSTLAELFALARQRRAIDLAVGTPGFPDTPEAVIERGVIALRSGGNQYEDPSGSLVLRQQIARSFGTPADPYTQVTVTTGATEALCAALFATVDPGDEVIVLEPFYEGFINAIRLAGAVPRFVGLRAPEWRLDPIDVAAAFGPRTRALLLNTPSNPTGHILTSAELDEIAEICGKWDVAVISDETYANLIYDELEHFSVADVPQLGDRSIVIGSLSKNLAISGWRLGYLRADAKRTEVLRRVHQTMTNGTAAPLQLAVGETDVLDGGWWKPAPALADRRDRAVRIFRRLGHRIQPPDGGCFLLADAGNVTGDCLTYVRQLLQESGVLVAPGCAFFADLGRGRKYVRVAFNRSLETLAAAERNLLPEQFTEEGENSCEESP
jgi:aminotransferase